MKRKHKKDDIQRFAVLDFETANPERDSICSLGIVIVENCEIVDSYYTKVNPQTMYFNKYCVEAHGLTYRDVKNSPKIDEVWKKVHRMIDGSPIVAHNAGFERSCINACADMYGIENDYKYIDTLKIARKYYKDTPNSKLNTVCESIGYKIKNYHNALDDAYACAYLLIDAIKNKGYRYE